MWSLVLCTLQRRPSERSTGFRMQRFLSARKLPNRISPGSCKPKDQRMGRTQLAASLESGAAERTTKGRLPRIDGCAA